MLSHSRMGFVKHLNVCTVRKGCSAVGTTTGMQPSEMMCRRRGLLQALFKCILFLLYFLNYKSHM